MFFFFYFNPDFQVSSFVAFLSTTPNAEFNSKLIGTNLKFLKNQKQKRLCAISYFLIFSGQFRASGNSTPGPSEAEKLIGSGKKNRDYLQKNGF